jgi:hypothetical protein
LPICALHEPEQEAGVCTDPEKVLYPA